MNEFITPPNHVNFKAKRLFGEMGQIIDGSVAYIDLNGGGPIQRHTHNIHVSETCIKVLDFELTPGSIL